MDDGRLILADMGGKWKGYTADITVTYPVNGKFTQKQKQIYEAVYEANLAVINVLRPGVNWDDMHLLSEMVIIRHLQEIGIIKKEYDLQEVQDKRVGATFYPHGLGHFLGLAVHDVGGYSSQCPPKSTLDGLNKLRTRRVIQQNMVLTVEPGCYFIPHLLQKTKQNEDLSKYINWELVQEYQHVGGVRIEDDIFITEHGCINLSADLPRTIEQIENCLATKKWKS